MNQNLKVSIIMPTYNNEDTVSQSIKSVIKQSYHNWELLIIDDGSSDNTYKILRDFSNIDSRIQVFHQKNQGPSVARKTGLKNISGDLLMFIDADDSIRSDAIETLALQFNNRSLDLCIYSWNQIKSGSVVPHVFSHQEVQAGKEELFRNIGYSLDWDKYGGGYPWNKMWRVKPLTENGMLYFDNRVKMLEDRLYVLAGIDKIKRIKFINVPLYNYMINEESTSHTNKRSKVLDTYYEVYRAIKLEYEYILNNHISAKKIGQKSLLQGEINYLMAIIKTTNKKIIVKNQLDNVIHDFKKSKFLFLNLKYTLKFIYLKIRLFIS